MKFCFYSIYIYDIKNKNKYKEKSREKWFQNYKL